MPPQIASAVFIVGIIGLFLLDRDREVRASSALCLPLMYVWATSSRSLTEWLAIFQTGRSPAGVGLPATTYTEGTPLDRHVMIVLMILAIIVLVRRGRIVELALANLPVVAFLLYGAISATWSDFPDITIRRWFKAVGCLLIVMVVLSERDRVAATKRLFVWAGFLLVPPSILLIKYYPAIGKTDLIVNISTWVLSPVGVTTHKNSLGLICQVFGIVFVWHFLAAYRDRQLAHRIRHLIVHGTALAMVVWLLVQANSVTSQSSFLLGTAFLVATSVHAIARRQWLVHLLVITLIAVPFATLFLGIGASALEGMGRDSTLTGRTEIWRHVCSLVNNPAVGTGFESFWLGNRLNVMHDYQLSLNEAHNGYIEIYISLGWVGVFLLAVVIVTGYRNIATCFRRNPDAGRLRLAYFLIVIVSAFTEAAFRTESITWTSFLLVTMATPQDWVPKRVSSLRVTAEASELEKIEPVAVGSSYERPGTRCDAIIRSTPATACDTTF